MINNAIHKKYIHDEIKNASPGKLIIMLYAGAIKSLEDSKLLVNKEDPYDFTQRITKAQNIIAELMGALKKDIFPELVENMARLYDFMFTKLVSAHKDKNLNHINQVLELLRSLKAGWAEAVEKSVEEEPVIKNNGEIEHLQTQKPIIKPKVALSFEA